MTLTPLQQLELEHDRGYGRGYVEGRKEMAAEIKWIINLATEGKMEALPTLLEIHTKVLGEMGNKRHD